MASKKQPHPVISAEQIAQIPYNPREPLLTLIDDKQPGRKVFNVRDLPNIQIRAFPYANGSANHLVYVNGRDGDPELWSLRPHPKYYGRTCPLGEALDLAEHIQQNEADVQKIPPPSSFVAPVD